MVGASMAALILSQALQKLIDSDRSCFIARTDYELLALRFIEYHGDVYTESLPSTAWGRRNAYVAWYD